MPSRYVVRTLSPARIPQAFPLLQVISSKLTLDGWSRYANAMIANRGSEGEGGIVAIENSNGYLHGVFGYRIADDLHCGRILDCENLVALDLVKGEAALDVLISAMETLARRHGCEALHVTVPHQDDGSHPLASMLLPPLRRSGLAVESVSLCLRFDAE